MREWLRLDPEHQRATLLTLKPSMAWSRGMPLIDTAEMNFEGWADASGKEA